MAEWPDCIAACALREIVDPCWPAEFEALRVRSYPWLLESALEAPGLGRFSFGGADPFAVVRAREDGLDVEVLRSARPGFELGKKHLAGDPFDGMRTLLRTQAVEDAPAAIPFLGGAVGWLGYELADRIESFEFRRHDVLPVPDLALLLVDRLVVFDHSTRRLFVLGLGYGLDARAARDAAGVAAEALVRDLGTLPPEKPLDPRGETAPAEALLKQLGARTFFDRSRYAAAVEQVKQRVLAGDVYQANLTQRIDVEHAGDPWILYRILRRVNPAPFAAYLELPEVTVVGSSPERFLSLSERGVLESRPIKGTRPRGTSPAEDERLRGELERSEKDRAENLMIVDLVRNDLGRVCEAGSVHVPELRAIEAYATVFHMVSTVRGRLRSDCDGFDAIRAAFPPGSMTGAPKISAMKILAHLEPVRRGIYSGALGWFDVRGGFDLSVVIRTILCREGRAHVHVGGAVVADSDPEGEYEESLDQGRALLRALAESS